MARGLIISVAALLLAACSVPPESVAGRYRGPAMGNGQDHLTLRTDGTYEQQFYLYQQQRPFAVNEGRWQVDGATVRLQRSMFVNDLTPERRIHDEDMVLRVEPCGSRSCLRGQGFFKGFDYSPEVEG